MTKELIITPIEPPLVEYFWDECAPILNRVMVLSPDELSLESTKAAVMEGRQRLVIILDEKKIIAVNIVDIITFETGMKALTIPITAGDRMAEWIERFHNICIIWGREMGCTELRNMSVRLGWKKTLEPLGWKNHFMVMRCEIPKLDETVISIKQGEIL